MRYRLINEDEQLKSMENQTIIAQKEIEEHESYRLPMEEFVCLVNFSGQKLFKPVKRQQTGKEEATI